MQPPLHACRCTPIVPFPQAFLSIRHRSRYCENGGLCASFLCGLELEERKDQFSRGTLSGIFGCGIQGLEVEGTALAMELARPALENGRR